MTKPISFSVPEDDREEIQRYAEMKGYGSASAFARFATFAQMRKNPLTGAEQSKLDRKYGQRVSDAAAPQQQRFGADDKENS